MIKTQNHLPQHRTLLIFIEFIEFLNLIFDQLEVKKDPSNEQWNQIPKDPFKLFSSKPFCVEI